MENADLFEENVKLKKLLRETLDILTDHEVYVYHGGNYMSRKIEKALEEKTTDDE